MSGVTVKTDIVRSQTLYVSSGVWRDLQALAMSNSTDDPLLSHPDALGDMLLRKALDAMPEVAERSKAITTFFKQLPPLKKPEEKP
jgi:hypothetical protein